MFDRSREGVRRACFRVSPWAGALLGLVLTAAVTAGLAGAGPLRQEIAVSAVNQGGAAQQGEAWLFAANAAEANEESATEPAEEGSAADDAAEPAAEQGEDGAAEPPAALEPEPEPEAEAAVSEEPREAEPEDSAGAGAGAE